MTKIFTVLAGQSCCSGLNFWAAQQRRPTEDVEIFVVQRAPEGEISRGCGVARLMILLPSKHYYHV